ELKEGLKKYIEFYNCKRLHQALKYKTPTEIYNNSI
ncbi:MAG: transposase, partial [Desulfobacterales bacterium]|nr:transposase [Desulfobacterales bacterium]